MHNKQKLIPIFSLLCISLLFSGCFSSSNNKEKNNTEITEALEFHLSQVSVIQAAKVMSKYKNDNNFVVIDLRTETLFKESHIPEAINVNCENDNFRKNVSNFDNTKTYLVYFSNDAKKKEIIATFQALGFNNLYYMNGGLEEWVNEGL